MLIDGGVLVGYLTAYLLKGARKAADRTLDALLGLVIMALGGLVNFVFPPRQR
jgi:hypothetical protein